jgi:hypothetical protein
MGSVQRSNHRPISPPHRPTSKLDLQPITVVSSTTVPALTIAAAPAGNGRNSPMRVSLLGSVSAPAYYRGTTALVVDGKRYAVTCDGKSGAIGAHAVADALAEVLRKKSAGKLLVSVRQVGNMIGSNTWTITIAHAPATRAS